MGGLSGQNFFQNGLGKWEECSKYENRPGALVGEGSHCRESRNDGRRIPHDGNDGDKDFETFRGEGCGGSESMGNFGVVHFCGIEFEPAV
jgi:hypothetical protein